MYTLPLAEVAIWPSAEPLCQAQRESINFVASVSIFTGSKARLLSRLVSRRMIRSLSSLFANGLLGIMKTTRVLFLRQLSAWGQLWQRSKAAREVLAVPPHLSIHECCLQTILITLLVDPHLRRSSGSMARRMTLRTGSWLGCKGTNLWWALLPPPMKQLTAWRHWCGGSYSGIERFAEPFITYKWIENRWGCSESAYGRMSSCSTYFGCRLTFLIDVSNFSVVSGRTRTMEGTEL